MSDDAALKIDIRGRGPDRVWLALRGNIDEHSDFAPILAFQAKSLVIDLSEVLRINSIGVRHWMQFVNDLGNTEVLFERCSVPIVQQLNMIAKFRGQGIVASVFAPYFCAKCEHSDTRLIELSGDIPKLDAAMQCPQCGGTLEFDDIAQTYLGFAGET